MCAVLVRLAASQALQLANERGEKLGDLEVKTDEMRSQASRFADLARSVL